MEELKSMIKKTSDTSLRAGCSVLQRVAVCCSVLQCAKAQLIQDCVQCMHASLHITDFNARAALRNDLPLQEEGEEEEQEEGK